MQLVVNLQVTEKDIRGPVEMVENGEGVDMVLYIAHFPGAWVRCWYETRLHGACLNGFHSMAFGSDLHTLWVGSPISV